MPTLYCPFCGLGPLNVYKEIGDKVYYKCTNCGRIVVTPIVMPDKVAETEVAEVAEKITE